MSHNAPASIRYAASCIPTKRTFQIHIITNSQLFDIATTILKMSRKPRKQKRGPRVTQTKQPNSTPQAPATPPPVIPAGYEQQQRDNTNSPVAHQSNYQRKSLSYFEIIYLVLTGGLLAITCILAYFANEQLGAVKWQISQTDRTISLMRNDQRPILVATPEEVTGFNIGDQASKDIGVVNTGKGVAFVDSSESMRLLVEGPEDAITIAVDAAKPKLIEEAINIVLPPEGAIIRGFKSDRGLTNEQIDMITNGKLSICLLGRVKYHDAGGRRLSIEYLFVYDRHAKRWKTLVQKDSECQAN